MNSLVMSPDGKTRHIMIEDIDTICFKCGRKLMTGEMAYLCEFNKNIFCKKLECKKQDCHFGVIQSEHIDFFGLLKLKEVSN